jgi:type III restriction enzyme
LEEELERDGVLGWLRNPSRKPWALTVPYRSGGAGGEDKGLYPDFLILREGEGGPVVDLIDPHTTSLSDARPSAFGSSR